MKICWLSDTDLIGSGYLNITIPLCKGLAERGHDVKISGLGYRGTQHDYPFSIIPAMNVGEGLGIIQNLYNMWHFDALVVALDIPLQLRILNMMNNRPFKYVGIMPVEADPVCLSWAMGLMQMDYRFIISEFGKNECDKVGVQAEHIQIGIDTDTWRLPTKEEKRMIRTNVLGIDDDTFVILTVADNQERKNLSKSLEVVSDFIKDGHPNTKYILVTREFNQVGWILRDLSQALGINDKVMIFERGMEFKKLWSLYAASDVFLLTSKAEGLCTLPDSEVWTVNGKVKIMDIENLEEVVTHTGELKRITEIFKRDYIGYIHRLKMSFGLPDINLTPKHLVYGAKRIEDGRGDNRYKDLGWIPIDELKRGDYVFYPRADRKFTRDIYGFYVTDYLKDVVRVDGKIYNTGRNQYESTFIHPQSKPLNEIIKVTPDFLSFLGYYISEGCFTGEGISFSFSSYEIEYQNEVKSLSKTLFGLDMKVYYRERHRCDMRIYHTLLGRLIAEMCGYHSHEKHLPEWALFMKEENLWALIRSMFLGDGNYFRGKQWVLRYSTISLRLAEQLQFVLSRLGIFASLKKNEKKPEYTVAIYRQDLWKVPFIDHSKIPPIRKLSSKKIELEDGYLLPISGIETTYYSGQVYNLEVNDDNSYLLAGGAVHNCMPLLEAMAVGIPCVATECTAIAEVLEDNRGYLIPHDYVYTDPFGNGNRYLASRSQGKDWLNFAFTNLKRENQKRVKKSRKYVESLKWEIAVDQLERALLKLNEQTQP